MAQKAQTPKPANAKNEAGKIEEQVVKVVTTDDEESERLKAKAKRQLDALLEARKNAVEEANANTDEDTDDSLHIGDL